MQMGICHMESNYGTGRADETAISMAKRDRGTNQLDKRYLAKGDSS